MAWWAGAWPTISLARGSGASSWWIAAVLVVAAGLLVRIFGSVIDRTGRGFEHMHSALKERAEELSPPVIAALPMLSGTELGIRGFEAHGSLVL